MMVDFFVANFGVDLTKKNLPYSIAWVRQQSSLFAHQIALFLLLFLVVVVVVLAKECSDDGVSLSNRKGPHQSPT